MIEIWNKEANYSIRSKDEKHKVKVEYWQHYGQKGVHIEITDSSDCLLHVFSIVLEKGIKKLNEDVNGN